MDMTAGETALWLADRRKEDDEAKELQEELDRQLQAQLDRERAFASDLASTAQNAYEIATTPPPPVRDDWRLEGRMPAQTSPTRGQTPTPVSQPTVRADMPSDDEIRASLPPTTRQVPVPEGLSDSLMRQFPVVEDTAATRPWDTSRNEAGFELPPAPSVSERTRLQTPSLEATRAPSSSAYSTPIAAGEYSDLINQAAERYNLDPKLIAAVMMQESGGRNGLTSSAGAQGLMQLMPGTARGLGVTDPWNPSQNIDGGAKYLRQMLDYFNGDMNKAIAAYNAGPGNIEKGFYPAETQRYVPAVLGLMGRVQLPSAAGDVINAVEGAKTAVGDTITGVGREMMKDISTPITRPQTLEEYERGLEEMRRSDSELDRTLAGLADYLNTTPFSQREAMTNPTVAGAFSYGMNLIQPSSLAQLAPGLHDWIPQTKRNIGPFEVNALTPLDIAAPFTLLPSGVGKMGTALGLGERVARAQGWLNASGDVTSAGLKRLARMSPEQIAAQDLTWLAERAGQAGQAVARGADIVLSSKARGSVGVPGGGEIPKGFDDPELMRVLGNQDHWTDRAFRSFVEMAETHRFERPQGTIEEWREAGRRLGLDPEAFARDVADGKTSPSLWFALHDKVEASAKQIEDLRPLVASGDKEAAKALQDLANDHARSIQAALSLENRAGSALRAMRETAEAQGDAGELLLERTARAAKTRGKADLADIRLQKMDDAIVDAEDLGERILNARPEELPQLQREVDNLARIGDGAGGNRGGTWSGTADGGGVRVGSVDGGNGTGGTGSGVGPGGDPPANIPPPQPNQTTPRPQPDLRLGVMTPTAQSNVQRGAQWRPTREIAEVGKSIDRVINNTESGVLKDLNAWVAEFLASHPSRVKPNEQSALTRAIDRIARHQSPDPEKEISEWLFAEAREIAGQARQDMRDALKRLGSAPSREEIQMAGQDIIYDYGRRIRQSIQERLEEVRTVPQSWGYAGKSLDDTGRMMFDFDAHLRNSLNDFMDQKLRVRGDVDTGAPRAQTNAQMAQQANRDLYKQWQASMKAAEDAARERAAEAERLRKVAEANQMNVSRNELRRYEAASDLINKTRLEAGETSYTLPGGKKIIKNQPSPQEVRGLLDLIDSGDDVAARTYLAALQHPSLLGEIHAARVLGMLSRTTTLTAQVISNPMNTINRGVMNYPNAVLDWGLEKTGERAGRYSHFLSYMGTDPARVARRPNGELNLSPIGVDRAYTWRAANAYWKGIWENGIRAAFGVGDLAPGASMSPTEEFLAAVKEGKPLFSDTGNVEIPRYGSVRKIPIIGHYARLIEAQDAMFRAISYAGEVQFRIELELDRLKLHGIERQAAREEIESNILRYHNLWRDAWDTVQARPSDEQAKAMVQFILEVGEAANDSVFQKNNWLTTLLLKLKEEDPTWVTKHAMPFTQVPVNVAGKAVGMTFPTSIATSGVRTLQAIKASKNLDDAAQSGVTSDVMAGMAREATKARGEAVKATGAAIEGALLTFVAGHWLAGNGFITGDERPDGNEDAGWKPRSLFIGGNYVPVGNILGPFGSPLALAANIRASMKQGKGLGEAILMTYANIAETTPYADRMVALVKLLNQSGAVGDPSRMANAAVASYGSTYLPGIIAQANELLRKDAARTPILDQGPAVAFAQGFMQNAPGASGNVPLAVNTRGYPRSRGEITKDIANPLNLLVKSYGSDDTEGLARLRELNIPFQIDRTGRNPDKDEKNVALPNTGRIQAEKISDQDMQNVKGMARQIFDRTLGQKYPEWLKEFPKGAETTVVSRFIGGADNYASASISPESFKNRTSGQEGADRTTSFKPRYQGVINPAEDYFIAWVESVNTALRAAIRAQYEGSASENFITNQAETRLNELFRDVEISDQIKMDELQEAIRTNNMRRVLQIKQSRGN